LAAAGGDGRKGATMCFVLEMRIGKGSRNLHSQIASEITRLIGEGLIGVGYALPSTRLLSEHLGLSRNTVLRAYENLAAEGLVEMRPPHGTFVSDQLPADISAIEFPKTVKPLPSSDAGREGDMVPASAHSSARYDFQYDRIGKDLAPVTAWRRIAFERMRALPHEMTKADHPAGAWELRNTIAEYLAPSRSIKIAPSQVIVTGGLQQSIALAGAMFARRGNRAVVEQPRYGGFDSALASYGYEIFPVEADRYGLRTSLLPEAGAALVCVTAGRQFPFGDTMPQDRREELCMWAHRNGAYILDTEIQNDYRYDGLLPPALMRDDRYRRTLLAGSFTTSMGGGVRLGYLVVPMDLAGAAVEASAARGNACSWLDQSILATFIKTGGYKHHLLRLRKAMMLRKDTVLDEIQRRFGPVSVLGENGGLFFTWRLPSWLPSSDDIVEALASVGISVNSFNSGFVSVEGSIVPDQRHLILGYGGMPLEELRAGSALLADTLERRVGAVDQAARSRPSLGLSMAP
jgi:GntR family transcriptional regulator/MocR family aminotransferase